MKLSYEELESKLNEALNKIKASQEQEPVGEVGYTDNRGGRTLSYCLNSLGDLPMGTKIYTAPVIVIPPDVAELQRENAELTRELAEQQAALTKAAVTLGDMAKSIQDNYYGIKGVDPREFLDVSKNAFFRLHDIDKLCKEELTKLLAKAKSANMVPVGYFQLVCGRYEQTVHPVKDADYIKELGVDTSGFFQLYAPQPGGSNE